MIGLIALSLRMTGEEICSHLLPEIIVDFDRRPAVQSFQQQLLQPLLLSPFLIFANQLADILIGRRIAAFGDALLHEFK